MRGVKALRVISLSSTEVVLENAWDGTRITLKPGEYLHIEAREPQFQVYALQAPSQRDLERQARERHKVSRYDPRRRRPRAVSI